MQFILKTIGMMIATPNNAFAHISNDADAHLMPSIIIFIVTSILASIILIPYGIVFEYEYEAKEYDFSQYLIYLISILISGSLVPAIIYLIGLRWSGNSDWRPTFATMFYINIILVVAMVPVVAIVAAASAETGAIYDISVLQHESLYTYMYYAIIVIISAWIVVLTVKAVKVVHTFGTLKSLAVIALSIIASQIVTSIFEFYHFGMG